MDIKRKKINYKEIVALNTFEAVRLRPTMYVGQVSPMEDKIPIIRDNKLLSVDKVWSPGYMHLIIEILENAIDEAKRMKGKMKNIWVTVNIDTNEIIIRDEGGGFHNAHKKHTKTRKNVVRTALEELHAGSNFIDTSTNILGTHGVGAAVTNILSEHFSVETANKKYYVRYKWKDFKVVDEEIRKKETKDKIGTEIRFIPSPQIFPGFKWDKEIIKTYLSFKQFLSSNDKVLKKLNINGYFIENGEKKEIEISENFLPKEHVKVDNPEWGTVIIWPSYEDSSSVSFINGSQCTGIHQKIVNDWCNDFFKYNLSHHFYETLISLNVPSTLMRFAEQNKSKYAVSRIEIEESLEQAFKSKLLRNLKHSGITKVIENKIEDRLYSDNIKKIRKAQRTSKRKISDKYSPASRTKENIYITEGLSAAGSVRQARNSEREGVYALKGKVKNAKKLSDLTNNKEILDIMSILGLDPSLKKQPLYKNIIIATDEDSDGHHISSLIIHFFNKWFPYVIEEGRLLKLITPLVACNHKNKRKYFFSLDEFNKFIKNNNISDVNYLKGLGSLSIEDWKEVMKKQSFFKITKDRSSNKFLDIAFGDSANKRKKWLEGVEKSKI